MYTLLLSFCVYVLVFTSLLWFFSAFCAKQIAFKTSNLSNNSARLYFPLKENVNYNALSVIKVDIYTIVQVWLNWLCKNRKSTLSISVSTSKPNKWESLEERKSVGISALTVSSSAFKHSRVILELHIHFYVSLVENTVKKE